jgi:anti-sigma B factor antagonist
MTATLLSGALTIPTAAQQAALMRDALSAGADGFDLSAVTECDTAGVQLLLAAKREAHERGAVLGLLDPSSAVRDALQRYGLETITSAKTPPQERS